MHRTALPSFLRLGGGLASGRFYLGAGGNGLPQDKAHEVPEFSVDLLAR